jgi:hypothetical protein
MSNVTKEQAELAVTILRTPGASHRDMVCALYNVIWGFKTLDEVRAATFDVGFPVFYECMVEACIDPEVKELWA